MTNNYVSDLNDEEWAVISLLIPSCKTGGRPRQVNIRHILNGIFYLLKTGCQWRMLPQNFPPWGTVHYYFRRWKLEGVCFKIHEQLREGLRKEYKKEIYPTIGIMDSQTVKTTEKRGNVAMMEERK